MLMDGSVGFHNGILSGRIFSQPLRCKVRNDLLRHCFWIRDVRSSPRVSGSCLGFVRHHATQCGYADVALPVCAADAQRVAVAFPATILPSRRVNTCAIGSSNFTPVLRTVAV